MWVVLAAEPFQLKPKTWRFPVVGEVPYKGFFNQRLAFNLKKNWKTKDGTSSSVTPAAGPRSAGSPDPILSKMLNRSEGDLANLIIHEMSHATIFVKDSVDFNENLATFIGDRGAERFLIYKYGIASRQYTDYMAEDEDYLSFVNHMLRGAHTLDSVYNSFQPTDSLAAKKAPQNRNHSTHHKLTGYAVAQAQPNTVGPL